MNITIVNADMKHMNDMGGNEVIAVLKIEKDY